MLFFLSLIPDEENKNKFISIYEKYRVLICKICMSETADYFLCEDAMQNTFVKIANNIDKIYSFLGNEQKVYISVIAKNCAIDTLKAENRFISESLDNHHDIRSKSSIQDEYVSKEQYKKIISFICKMDENYRDVLILSFVNNLSPIEIASTLNRSIHTVRTQLSRGKVLLQKKLKELGIE